MENMKKITRDILIKELNARKTKVTVSTILNISRVSLDRKIKKFGIKRLWK